ncbi:hypothetical protein J6590_047767 [Homalodisca vitripennis]|nr:hypothetical protein J6590_047767 [Homalodisca vitripennis]
MALHFKQINCRFSQLQEELRPTPLPPDRRRGICTHLSHSTSVWLQRHLTRMSALSANGDLQGTILEHNNLVTHRCDDKYRVKPSCTITRSASCHAISRSALPKQVF